MTAHRLTLAAVAAYLVGNVLAGVGLILWNGLVSIAGTGLCLVGLGLMTLACFREDKK